VPVLLGGEANPRDEEEQKQTDGSNDGLFKVQCGTTTKTGHRARTRSDLFAVHVTAPPMEPENRSPEEEGSLVSASLRGRATSKKEEAGTASEVQGKSPKAGTSGTEATRNASEAAIKGREFMAAIGVHAGSAGGASESISGEAVSGLRRSGFGDRECGRGTRDTVELGQG